MKVSIPAACARMITNRLQGSSRHSPSGANVTDNAVTRERTTSSASVEECPEESNAAEGADESQKLPQMDDSVAVSDSEDASDSEATSSEGHDSEDELSLYGDNSSYSDTEKLEKELSDIEKLPAELFNKVCTPLFSYRSVHLNFTSS